MDTIINYDSLMEQYKKSKEALAETDDSLRRVYGREPFDPNSGGPGPYRFRRRSPDTERTYSRKRPIFTKGRVEEEHESLEEETPDEEDSTAIKPSLPSTVVAKHHHRSRKTAIDEQKSNLKVKARNRRMFGVLVMGTLQKFQCEEKKRQHKESMRVKIEKKVEAATEEERERIIKEKEYLIKKRQEMKSEVRCYEKQLERAETHDIFQNNYKKILKSSVILTKTVPHIFFKPASHTAATKKCFEESNARIAAILEDKKAAFQSELEEIKESYRKESEETASENQCLEEESESQDVAEPESESESFVVEQEDSMEVEEESTGDRRFRESLEDQEFEPIYD